ncbi:MAG: hypothetical protein PHX24_01540 [Acidithiobacillus sp.]|nr:hypothetical protein [Acidithiobacillus sp.]
MHIEIIGENLPLSEVSRIVCSMAKELGGEAHWNGEKFQIREKDNRYDDYENDDFNDDTDR